MCKPTKIARKLPTEDQLERVARQHLKFEVFCLLDSLQCLGNQRVAHKGIGKFFDFKKNKHRKFNHPVSYHDMLIHTRVIADFLRCPSRCKRYDHRDDVEAGDYIDDWRGNEALEESDRKIINKAFAHLSRSRATMEAMSLSKRAELAIKTLYGLQEFIHKVPDQYTKWFSDIDDKLSTCSISEGRWYFGESES